MIISPYMQRKASQKALQLNAAQIRAARALLHWTQDDLAGKAHMPLSALKRIEVSDGPVVSRKGYIGAIREAFETAGVVLRNSPLEASVGLRLGTDEAGSISQPVYCD